VESRSESEVSQDLLFVKPPPPAEAKGGSPKSKEDHNNSLDFYMMDQKRTESFCHYNNDAENTIK